MQYKPTWDLRSIPDEQFQSEAGRRRGTSSSRRAKVLRPCPKCGAKFGARELKAHLPQCDPERNSGA
jgi:hypothetical protein